jgi:enoyl-CoA hydratase/carnithine racemase
VAGEEAARIGLADRLADPDGLRAAAHQLAAAAPLAVRSIRATMRPATCTFSRLTARAHHPIPGKPHTPRR